MDSGFMLGDGVWEGLRLHRGVLLFIQARGRIQRQRLLLPAGSQDGTRGTLSELVRCLMRCGLMRYRLAWYCRNTWTGCMKGPKL